MNTYRIKITGTTEISEKLDDLKDYSLVLKRCAIKSINKKYLSKENDHDYCFNLESLDEAILINEGNTISGRAKSKSKALRGRAFVYSNEIGVDSEKFYQDIMTKLIDRFDDVVDLLK